MAVDQQSRWPDRHKNKDIDPQYPYNQVTVWPGGQEIHIDSTPGKERIRIAHPSGTYTEMYHNGDQTTFVTGDQHNVNKSGVTLSIEKNGDISIGGQGRFMIGGGAHIEVAGDAGIAVGGDTLLAGGGNMKMSIQDLQIGARGNAKLNVAGNMDMRIAGSTSIQSSGPVNIQTQGAMSMGSESSMNMASKGPTTVSGSAVHINKPGTPGPGNLSSVGPVAQGGFDTGFSSA